MIIDKINEEILSILDGTETFIKKVLSDFHAGAFSSLRVEGLFTAEESDPSFESAASPEEGGDSISIQSNEAYEPLDRLCAAFGLGEKERFVLVLLLGFNVMPGWTRYASQIQGGNGLGVTNYVISFICAGIFGETILLPRILKPDAPLIRYGVVRSPDKSNPVDLWSFLQLNHGVMEYLLSLSPDTTQGKLPLCDRAPERRELNGLLNFLTEDPSRLDSYVVHLFGPMGSEFREAGAFVGQGLGGPVLSVSAKELLASDGFRRDLLRELRLCGGSVVVDISDYFDPPDSFRERALGRLIPFIGELSKEAKGAVIFVGGEARWRATLPDGLRLLSAEVRLPSREERRELWQSALKGSVYEAMESLDGLVERYRLSKTQIFNAAEEAKAQAAIENTGDPSSLRGHIAKAVFALSGDGKSLAMRVPLFYDWEDLILKPGPKLQLEELCNDIKYRERLSDSWGYTRAFGGSGGVHALFYGESGTGKTMAAGVIAKNAGLELLRVDLSMVVSKYIGETEKNLSRIFEEARRTHAILFFDEADALFGKRSEVKDARDRYANIEVGYLLQKIEEFDGVTILATNMRNNVDMAFTRRMHHIINFPSPEKEEAMEMWKKAFPPDAPLSEEIDFEYLSNLSRLNGALIRNTAVKAALFAAEEQAKASPGDGPVRIGMYHIVRALRREYGKIGVAYSKNFLGAYYDLAFFPWDRRERR